MTIAIHPFTDCGCSRLFEDEVNKAKSSLSDKDWISMQTVVRSFVLNMEVIKNQHLHYCPPIVNGEEDSLERARSHCADCVFLRLRTCALGGSEPTKSDIWLDTVLGRLAQLPPECHHLPGEFDLSTPLARSRFNQAIEALQDIPNVHSTSSKMVCVMECKMYLTELLGLCGTQFVGADQMTPCFIYALVMAQVPRLHTELRFIAHFCDQATDWWSLGGECLYDYVSLLGNIGEDLSTGQLRHDYQEIFGEDELIMNIPKET